MLIVELKPEDAYQVIAHLAAQEGIDLNAVQAQAMRFVSRLYGDGYGVHCWESARAFHNHAGSRVDLQTVQPPPSTVPMPTIPAPIPPPAPVFVQPPPPTTPTAPAVTIPPPVTPAAAAVEQPRRN